MRVFFLHACCALLGLLVAAYMSAFAIVLTPPFVFGEPGYFYGPRWLTDGLAIANFTTVIMAVPALVTRLIGLKLKRNDPWLYVVAAASVACILSGVISEAIIGFQGTWTLAMAVFGALSGALFWLIAVRLPVMIWPVRAA